MTGVSFGKCAAELQMRYDDHHTSDLKRLSDDIERSSQTLTEAVRLLTELRRSMPTDSSTVDLSELKGLDAMHEKYETFIEASPFELTNPFPKDPTACSGADIENMIGAIEHMRSIAQSEMPRTTNAMQERGNLLNIIAEITRDMLKNEVTLLERIQRRIAQGG